MHMGQQSLSWPFPLLQYNMRLEPQSPAIGGLFCAELTLRAFTFILRLPLALILNPILPPHLTGYPQ